MSSKLSDEELDSLDQWASADLTTSIAQEIWALTEEVRRTRALLSAPHDREVTWHPGHRGPRVTFPFGGEDKVLDADRALSLGAALIRAALAARAATAAKQGG